MTEVLKTMVAMQNTDRQNTVTLLSLENGLLALLATGTPAYLVRGTGVKQ